MTKLSKKITGIIKKEKLSQKPKIIFVLKNISFWFLFAFSAFIGAIAFSVIFMAILEADFKAGRKLFVSPIAFVRTFLPFVWILTFTLLFLLAFFGMRHTKKGYRFSAISLVGINLVISLFLGVGLYTTGISYTVERAIAQSVPVYELLEERREKLWNNPEKGLLVGTVQKQWNGKFFVLEDPQEHIWNIFFAKDAAVLPPPIQVLLGKKETNMTPEMKKTLTRIWTEKKDEEKKEKEIKISGKKLSENEFEAEIVLPWMHHRMIPKVVEEGKFFLPPPRKGKENRKEIREEFNMNPEKIKKHMERKMHVEFPPKKQEVK